MTGISAVRVREDLVAPEDSVAFIDVPTRRFFAVDGAGDPDRAPEFQRAIRSLYAVAYTLKGSLRRARVVMAPVGPVEGLWTTESRGAFDAASKEHFRWTLLLPIPEEATDQQARAALQAAPDLGPSPSARVRMLTLSEGRSAQTVHVGPYCTESRSIERLHDAIIQAGLMFAGSHHEIYLDGGWRAHAGRLRTILRQPVRSAS